MKIRIRFSKLGKVRFTSHRDVARIWERALRRAAVPVAYTEGFSPHPKLSFGLALVGVQPASAVAGAVPATARSAPSLRARAFRAVSLLFGFAGFLGAGPSGARRFGHGDVPFS